MLKNIKQDYSSWLILIGSLVLLLEVLFFNKGLIFSLFFSGLMIYLGKRRAEKGKGKILFWGGIIFLIASIFNMMTVKFFLIAILLHLLIQYGNSKRAPKIITPQYMDSKDNYTKSTMQSSKPLLGNVLFGQQKTPNEVYEWNDVNIQAGVGDTVIDLSYTVFPKGETVIMIRNVIGNIRILVPYETQVSINHSVMVGSVEILGFHDVKNFNQVYQLKTPGYDQAEQRVKILTSMIVGNIEVSTI